jgi:hypothetical protein
MHVYHLASVGYPAGYHEPTKIENTAYTWHFVRNRHRASQLIAALILSVNLAILATPGGTPGASHPDRGDEAICTGCGSPPAQ